jgi:hypothetical protein
MGNSKKDSSSCCPDGQQLILQRMWMPRNSISSPSQNEGIAPSSAISLEPEILNPKPMKGGGVNLVIPQNKL